MKDFSNPRILNMSEYKLEKRGIISRARKAMDHQNK